MSTAAGRITRAILFWVGVGIAIGIALARILP